MAKEFWREPDSWEETRDGYKLVAVRNAVRAWCGYVGIPGSHPLFGKDQYKRIPVSDRGKVQIDRAGPISLLLEAAKEDDGCVSLDVLANVHGGITYASGAHWRTFDSHWYFGFDCAHSGDLTPHSYYTSKWHYGEYRTLDYVKENIERLFVLLKSLEEKFG